MNSSQNRFLRPSAWRHFITVCLISIVLPTSIFVVLTLGYGFEFIIGCIGIGVFVAILIYISSGKTQPESSLNISIQNGNFVASLKGQTVFSSPVTELQSFIVVSQTPQFGHQSLNMEFRFRKDNIVLQDGTEGLKNIVENWLFHLPGFDRATFSHALNVKQDVRCICYSAREFDQDQVRNLVTPQPVLRSD